MSDEPRLEVLRDSILLYLTAEEVAADLDAADRAAGIVRVDTRDRRVTLAVANAIFEWWEDSPDQGWDGAAEAVLATLREAAS